ncbi:MAG: thiamine pyrophosphate-dependent enzyme, partial [Alphaproteobacteria bacterium]
MTQKIDTSRFLDLYSNMLLSRRVDDVEEALARRGETHFFIPGSGHEAIAALAHHLSASDWLHCHYRDRALALARGVTVEQMLLSSLSKAESNSAGRRMPGFPSDPSLHILNTPTLVGNSALQAVGVAMNIKDQPERPLVLCSVGDGSSQQGEYLEAIGEAVRSHLPVLFVIEDNGYALSTVTAGKTFFSTPAGDASQFYGLEINRVDGTDPIAVDHGFAKVVAEMRDDRGPRLLVINSERLASHTNADDQSVYRDTGDLEHIRAHRDPIKNLAASLEAVGISSKQLSQIATDIDARVTEGLAAARRGTQASAVFDASAPLPPALADAAEYRGTTDDRDLTMLDAFRATLRHHLSSDPRVVLYGEDIEDPKGDVFGLTRGLSSEFPDRVINSALSESTIIGASIGRALAGQRPVAFLQFADFIPIAYNQIMSEMGAMYWRSNGDWQCPVIIIAVCGGYRP